MSTPLQSLVQSGTKLWLDSVDPELVANFRRLGATGATSNPAIISGLLTTDRFDREFSEQMKTVADQEGLAWAMTDYLVAQAQSQFADVWQATKGNDGYVSFEVDPMIDASESTLTTDERTARYIGEAKRWSDGHQNRMIKVPATPAGLDAIEEIVAAGIPINVTLIFTSRQYQQARDAVLRGYQRCQNKDLVKSVYSIFVSRIDVYTEKHVAQLCDAAQGLVGIVNAQRIWQENQEFWSDKQTTLDQEIVFASTGTKDPSALPWKYVEALAGSDIQTNPPATNQAIQDSDVTFTRKLDQLPSADVLADIDANVDFAKMEEVLMSEGLAKFAAPHQKLLQSTSDKLVALTS